MSKLRMVVTGATGKTGSVVVADLLKAGYPVRAMVHREDDRSARLRAQGAEIVVADMSDVERQYIQLALVNLAKPRQTGEEKPLLRQGLGYSSGAVHAGDCMQHAL